MLPYRSALKYLFVAVVILAVITTEGGALAGPPMPTPQKAIEDLEAKTGEKFTVAWATETGLPSYVVGSMPSGTRSDLLQSDPAAAATQFLAMNSEMFGIANASDEFVLDQVQSDDLGMTHVRLQQVYSGIPVNGGQMIVHYSPDGEWVTAVNGYYVPQITLASTSPAIDASSATQIAVQRLPNGKTEQEPILTIYTSALEPGFSRNHLVWTVLLNAGDVRNLYVIDAQTGTVLAVKDRLYVGRNRETYTANKTSNLPGILKRSENTPAVNDKDVDNAHDFAGATYDYFWGTHGRDSYDGKGAKLISTAHYYSVAICPNAFWNGEQMVYCDNYPAKDVVAHELTHAVTERTANLVYEWQSGALNESFSDVFGAMVDRDDWFMGEDLPGGAIRSLADPSLFGQPENTSQYDRGGNCDSDNGNVHQNSGIPNYAFYLIATDAKVGKDKAERIYFRALSTGLTDKARFKDARVALEKAARDLYGAEIAGITSAKLDSVGMTTTWDAADECEGCSAQALLSDDRYADMLVLAPDKAKGTLYQTRDGLMAQSKLGQDYIQLYYDHQSQIKQLVLSDPQLTMLAVKNLNMILPKLSYLTTGQGKDPIITQQDVGDLNAFLDALVVADQDGELAQVIQRERERLDMQKFVGKRTSVAWQLLSRRDASRDFEDVR